MHAIVIGGSGQIGGWLMRELAARRHEVTGTYATVRVPGLEPLDATDLEAASRFIAERRPDVVFYPAGFTWVDGCERDPELARLTNRDAPLNAARATAAVGGRFVGFSTDYVFDGAAGPYDEASTPRPLSVYGQAKLEAEQRITEELGERQLALRTCWVYGPEIQGKNYAYQLIRNLRAGKTWTCPSDQISSPSYGPDVAMAAVCLAEQGAHGLYHVAGPEVMDRVAFSQAIAEAFGLDGSRIQGRPTAELSQGAARPLQSGLLIGKLEQKVPGVMRGLAGCLADFRERLGGGEGWADPMV